MSKISYMTVEEAEATPYISPYTGMPDGTMVVPQDYVGIIPRKCDCGADFVISSNRTMVKCSSPTCYIKVAWCATKLYRALGIKGFGIETFKEIARTRGCTSLIEILQNPPAGSGILLREGLETPRTWATCIAMLGLPKLKETAQKVFGGCNGLEDFCTKATEEGGVYPYLQKRLGGSVMPVQVLQVIKDNAHVLQEVENIFKIKPESAIKLKVAITGDITKCLDDNGCALTQEGFLEYANKKLEQHSIQLIASKAFSQIIAVVADSPSNSEKYLAGKRRGILITSDKLVDFVIALHEASLKPNTEE